MSVVLPNLNLAGAVVGTKTLYDFSTIVQTGVNPLQIDKMGSPKLGFLNESPVGMQLQLAQSLRSYNIAAGAWGTLDLDADDKGFYWTPQYILLPNPAVNLLLLTYLPPGDSGTAITVLGNSPIQGVAVITNTTAQFLQGIGQTLSVTELDDVGGFPIIGPTNGANMSLALGARDAANVMQDILELHGDGSIEATVFKFDGSGNFGDFEAQNIYAGGAVKLINSVFTTGLYGVAGVFADSGVVNVTTTGLKNIVALTTPASATPQLVRVSFTARLQNGTTPQNYTCQITYTDGFTNAARTQIMLIQQLNGGTALANGASAILATNNIISGVGYPLTVQPATTVTVQFNDPANTPADKVRAVIEMLA